MPCGWWLSLHGATSDRVASCSLEARSVLTLRHRARFWFDDVPSCVLLVYYLHIWIGMFMIPSVNIQQNLTTNENLARSDKISMIVPIFFFSSPLSTTRVAAPTWVFVHLFFWGYELLLFYFACISNIPCENTNIYIACIEIVHWVARISQDGEMDDGKFIRVRGAKKRRKKFAEPRKNVEWGHAAAGTTHVVASFLNVASQPNCTYQPE